MRLPFVFLSLVLASVILATPVLDSRADYILHEKRAEHPAWTRTRRLPPLAPLPLRIGLKQRNLDLLPDYLMAVSDPESPSYGQHWTSEQVVKAFAPPDEASETVRRWLVAAGFEAGRISRSPNKAWVEVRGATIDEVERLLDARYHVFKRDDGEEHVGKWTPCFFGDF